MSEPVVQPVYAFEGFRLDTQRRVLLGVDGRPIALTPRLFDALLYLVENAGGLLTKEQLLEALWPNVVVEEHNLNKTMSELRRVLGEKPGEHRFIVTQPGRGYRFVAAVKVVAREADEVSPAAFDTPDAPAADPTSTDLEAVSLPTPAAGRAGTPLGSRAAVVLAVTLIVAAGTVIVGRAMLGSGEGPARPTAAEISEGSNGGSGASQTHEAPPGLAVLPFEDLSPNHDQGYFADGIAEALLDTLTRVSGLNVADRRSSFSFKGKSEDVRTIGTALGVPYLLEGSVSRDRDDVRIGAQLIDAETGYHVWSDRYERKLTDVFAVQDEIAAKVASALQVTLGVGALAKIPGMTRNAEAYDEYLKGFRPNAPSVTLDSARESVAHLQRAVLLDPGFATAWIELGDLYRFALALVPDKRERDEWQRNSLEAYENAQKAAPDSPVVLITMADMKARSGDWLEAGRLYAQYLPIAERYGLKDSVREGGGFFLLRVGRAHEAIKKLEDARAAHPREPNVSANLAEAYSDIGDLDASLAEFDRGLRLGGNETVLRGAAAIAALATHDADEIRRRLAPGRPPVLRPGETDIAGAMARFLDDPTGARAEIERLAADETALRRRPRDYALLAAWAAYYHEPLLALDLQRKYVASGVDSVRAAFSLWEPIFREMRKLPGFKDLVREMGLVDYWRAYGWNDFCRPADESDFECS